MILDRGILPQWHLRILLWISSRECRNQRMMYALSFVEKFKIYNLLLLVSRWIVSWIRFARTAAKRHWSRLAKIQAESGCTWSWSKRFLDNRVHYPVDFLVHASRPFFSHDYNGHASIVQGSGIGPSAYDFWASDLHPLNHGNYMVKCADDSYLIVSRLLNKIPSEFCWVGRCGEWSEVGNNNCSGREMQNINSELVSQLVLLSSAQLNHVKEWANCNSLRLNTDKTKESIIPKFGKARTPPIPGITRVATLNILGVSINEDLQASNRVENFLPVCSLSLFAPSQTQYPMTPRRSSSHSHRATTIARLMYAVPAWWGLTSERHRASIERLYQRLQRMGYFHRDASGTLAPVEMLGICPSFLLSLPTCVM